MFGLFSAAQTVQLEWMCLQRWLEALLAAAQMSPEDAAQSAFQDEIQRRDQQLRSMVEAEDPGLGSFLTDTRRSLLDLASAQALTPLERPLRELLEDLGEWRA